MDPSTSPALSTIQFAGGAPADNIMPLADITEAEPPDDFGRSDLGFGSSLLNFSSRSPGGNMINKPSVIHPIPYSVGGGGPPSARGGIISSGGYSGNNPSGFLSAGYSTIGGSSGSMFPASPVTSAFRGSPGAARRSPRKGSYELLEGLFAANF